MFRIWGDRRNRPDKGSRNVRGDLGFRSLGLNHAFIPYQPQRSVTKICVFWNTAETLMITKQNLRPSGGTLHHDYALHSYHIIALNPKPRGLSNTKNTHCVAKIRGCSRPEAPEGRIKSLGFLDLGLRI